MQNLLILTAIKANTSKVMDYITRLNQFDFLDIAQIALNANLFEEAFFIYKKFDVPSLAITVLLDQLGSLERAYAYAEKTNKSEVWSKLAKAQLEAGLVKEAVGKNHKTNL